MQFKDLLGGDRIVLGLRAPGKVQALTEATRRLATHLAVEPAAVLQAILAREQMGSTGLGRGFALPHARMSGIAKASGLLLRLARPIEFEAIDRQPVDIIFLLLMPEDNSGEQMAALASVSRSMRNDALLAAIRKARTAAELYGHIVDLAE